MRLQLAQGQAQAQAQGQGQGVGVAIGVLSAGSLSAAALSATYAGASEAFEVAALLGDADGAFNLARMYEWRQVTRSMAVTESSGDSGNGSDEGGGGGVGGRHGHGHLHRVAASTAEAAKEAAHGSWVDAATYWHGVALDGYTRLRDTERVVVGRYHYAKLCANPNPTPTPNPLTHQHASSPNFLAPCHSLLQRGGVGDCALGCLHWMRAAHAADADSAWSLSEILYGRSDDGTHSGAHRFPCGRDDTEAARYLAVAAQLGHPAAIAAVQTAKSSGQELDSMPFMVRLSRSAHAAAAAASDLL